jgi:hypothetical protein
VALFVRAFFIELNWELMEQKAMRKIIIFLAVAMFLPVMARAELVRYDNRNSFQSAIENETVLTFEGLSGIQGKEFEIEDVTFDFWRAGYAQSYWAPSTYLIAGNGGEVFINMNQSTGAFGLEIGWHNSDPHPIRYYLNREDDSVIESGTLSPVNLGYFNSDDTFFIGWTSDEQDIGYLALLPDDSSYYICIDNVIYGSPVPIPGAIWLLGTGLVGLIGLRKNK